MLLDKLMDAVYTYHRDHGYYPKKINIGWEYYREYVDIMTNSGTYHFTTGYPYSDSFASFPIKWTTQKRIECLPRKTFKLKMGMTYKQYINIGKKLNFPVTFRSTFTKIQL